MPNDNEGTLVQAWKARLVYGRRKPKDSTPNTQETSYKLQEYRTEIERDFDRILFSTPVRRLADKTQVFPLDKNDSVRNRLTHSYEVSNLARGFGIALCKSEGSLFSQIENADRDIPAQLAAIGLVHDLGNPPFGHQGEVAIQHWFSNNKSKILGDSPTPQDESYFKDFELFEGNAQGFRLVTRLQVLSDEYGLNLTRSTLAAMMKYPTSSSELDKEVAAKKKHGYFKSEESIAKDVLSAVRLEPGKRHPCAYIMEACDDIAYVVLDAEDSVKKGLASFPDLMHYLKHHEDEDEVIKYVRTQSAQKHEEYRNEDLSPAELNDISMQRFRVYAIGAMLHEAIKAFKENQESFVNGTQTKPLLEVSNAEKLRKTLKSFSLTHGYTHKTVLKLELEGFNTISGLMDMLWFGIDKMAGEISDVQKQQHPFARYVYTLISENYRRVFEVSFKTMGFPLWYHKCQLLSDMVAGMTDSYACRLFSDLKCLQGDCKLDTK